MPGKRNYPAEAQHSVTANPNAFVGSTAESRAQAKRAAIDAILQRIPTEDQAAARRLFDDPRNLAFASSSDPEIARLLGILNSIREIEMKPQLDQAEADRKAARDAKAGEISVLVALDPSLAATDVRARVVRRPGDAGQPLLLLRESDATSADLARGLRAAALSVKRHGVNPAKPVRMNLRAPRGSAAPDEPTAQRLLDYVKSGSPQTIHGVGTVRANTIIARVPASADR